MKVDHHAERAEMNVHIRRAWKFLVVPLLWLAAWVLSSYSALAWLATVGIYIVLISLMAIMNVPNQNNRGQMQIGAPKVCRTLGLLVWGGFLALLYWLAYFLIFHFQDLNAH